MTEAFNPLELENLAQSIVNRMLETNMTPLNSIPKFFGAGVYALYYEGPFPAYADLVSRSQVAVGGVPIYVGKAVPKGGRRGVNVAAPSTTRALRLRIQEHAKSVIATSNLDIGDFGVRWLVMADIWIPLGESALIRRYRPVWNTVVDGFGNHAPGAGRRQGMRSRWDVLHPGRSWAADCQPRQETPSQIEQEITEYLRSRP